MKPLTRVLWTVTRSLLVRKPFSIFWQTCSSTRHKIPPLGDGCGAQNLNNNIMLPQSMRIFIQLPIEMYGGFANTAGQVLSQDLLAEGPSLQTWYLLLQVLVHPAGLEHSFQIAPLGVLCVWW